MANICSNVFQINFKAESMEEKKRNAVALIGEMMEELPSFEVISPSNVEDDFDTSLEVEFTSKWVCPTGLIEEQSEKYNCSFIGVSWEFGNQYVNVFEN